MIKPDVRAYYSRWKIEDWKHAFHRWEQWVARKPTHAGHVVVVLTLPIFTNIL